METLHPGERFTFDKTEFLLLGIGEGDYLAIGTNPLKHPIPFDVNGYTDRWMDSSLRRVLDDYADVLDKRGITEQLTEMTAINGDDDYGACFDYMTILTFDQYRKYREIIRELEKPGESIWTLTPVACNKNEKRCIAIKDGSIEILPVKESAYICPVVLFSSPRTVVRKTTELVLMEGVVS